MLKLVLDTNTIVSAFFWEGNEFELLKKIEEGKALLFTSEEILNEIEDVINRPKFKEVLRATNQTTAIIIQKIISLSQLVIGPRLRENIVKDDQKDDKFIESAVNANADIIVSGDSHLLKIKEHKGIRIMKTIEVIKLL